ncbi:TetR/AcrR family transcriptional regulator [Roseateles sp. DAIF2]|uniref:TetR/AcrR family transcriptional regulator n=1 Tax=Roseateles sp. DAIF2 TaxID=2714952 RepID=UPI0018A3264C|nr:TetR/AcrR family transcriptional regulator [Roseateles sp. DAIF2]QPF73478.1 TetR/AcrR family transcriptional regulator [Roseateles sp. DAIF2]
MLLFPLPADLSERPARDRILLTAHELFYREGIRATGVDRVIAESGVAKLTFYRHFPSKQELVIAYLELRHQAWMDWFRAALARHRAGSARRPRQQIGRQLAAALAEWFGDPAYRGCAFINAMVELGGSEPEVRRIALSHKQAMAEAIGEQLLQPAATSLASALGLLVDGAILRAQLNGDAQQALGDLERLAEAAVEPHVAAATLPAAKSTGRVRKAR